MTPGDAGPTILHVWQLKATDTDCDFCSRRAKYIVDHHNTVDYLCLSHTAKVMENVVSELRTGRVVG